MLVAPGLGAVGPELPPFGLGDFQRSEPIAITADKLEAQDSSDRRTLEFRRNVVVKQGPLRLSSDVLSAEYRDGDDQPRRLEARGRVEIREGARRARCAHAIYDRPAQTIRCLGKPAELWDGEDHLTGTEIRFDLAARSVAVTGGTRVDIHRDLTETELSDFGEIEDEEVAVRLREGGPISIVSDALEASDPGAERRIRFAGGVVLEQGDVTLRAEELVALYPPEATQPERLLASGEVVLTEGESREGRCAHAEYTLEERVIVCEGDAVLREGGDRLEGDRIAFDFRARKVDAVGRTRLTVSARTLEEGTR
jgi:lipopolysaccharide transport protein LptA